MAKKQKRSKKVSKSSKRSKDQAQSEEGSDMDSTIELVDISPASVSAPEKEVNLDRQQAESVSASTSASESATSQPEAVGQSQLVATEATSVIPAEPVAQSHPTTRSDAAKANIKEGLRLHQIAGRPTKQQLVLVFGQKGYLLTWPKRTEKFGITPETFQAALAKGVPAVPLTPVAKPAVEKPKGTA